MQPLLYALAAGVGIYAGAKRVQRGIGLVMKRLGEPEAQEPRLVGTLERDPATGVYRLREERSPQG